MEWEESQDQRSWLLERVITEARAYANADNQTRLMRLGWVDGYLGVGVAFGYWSRRSWFTQLRSVWGVIPRSPATAANARPFPRTSSIARR